MSDGQALHSSPYVEQIEKYAHSLKQLSQTFLGLEEKRQAFSDEEIEAMFSAFVKKCAANVKNAAGAGAKILSIRTRWDMKFFLRWIIMEMN